MTLHYLSDAGEKFHIWHTANSTLEFILNCQLNMDTLYIPSTYTQKIIWGVNSGPSNRIVHVPVVPVP